MKKIFVSAYAFLCITVCTYAFTVHGSVKDMDGKALSSVAVSDGFTVVATAEDGSFSIDANPQASYLFVSIPSNCAVPEFQGAPFIYKKICLSNDARMNFVLRRIKTESRFKLFACADIQCRNMYHLRRFSTETVPDMRKCAASFREPVYGVALGDLAYSENQHNANFIFSKLFNEMSSSKTGVMMFPVNGNHDFDFENGGLDERNASLMVRAKRCYEAVFGPRNYSFNRGDAHIVCMDDVMSIKMGSRNYNAGFLPEQVEWLRQDLNLVPKDKLVIVCVHVPFRSMQKKSETARQVLSLLGEFDNAIILSGHTHHSDNVVLDCGIREYIIGAVSGTWWWSNLNSDGTPNGYGILSVDGNKVSDFQYKSTGHPLSYQVRAYRGDALVGGEKDKYGMLQFPYGHDEIIANVWNYHEGWKVELYENGRKTADFTRIPVKASTLVPGPDSCQDWWAIGYHTGILGRGNRPNRRDYCPACSHLFKARLLNPECGKVKVVVTDNKGNRYVCGNILEGADYTEAAPYGLQPVECWDAIDENR